MESVRVHDASQKKTVEVKRFEGRLTNISPFPYEAYLKVRFLDNKGRLVQESGFYEDDLAGHSSWSVPQYIWGNIDRYEIVEIRAKRKLLVSQKDVFALLLLGGGVAFGHLCLAAWMNVGG